jgi:transketolase
VDRNGLQGFGPTQEIADLADMCSKFEAFGLQVHEVDGHSPETMSRLFRGVQAGPAAVLAHTIKGHGVSFMENRFEWHYLPLSSEHYKQAVEELTVECAARSAKL